LKAAVLYKSKTGFTRTYAQWIAEELSADLYEAPKVDVRQLDTYDTVVYGAGLYAGGINGIGLIKNNLDALTGKKIIVFATGATPVREKTTNELRDTNFSPEQLKQIRFFYLRGGFDYHKLKPVDKLLMILLKLKLKGKKHREADERGMLAAYSRPVDFTRRENIRELVAYAKA